MKVAEKAETEARKARRKLFTLQQKWDKTIENQEILKKMSESGAKRGPENQSPGKEGDGEEGKDKDGKWVSPKKTAAVNTKKKEKKSPGRKEKTAEELALEKAFYSGTTD